MYELLKEFIRPELLILVPVLYLMGVGLKKSQVDDRLIPMLLGMSGGVLALLYLAASVTAFDVRTALMVVFSAVTQGVLCAGASVYVHQLAKQAGKVE